MCSKKKQDLNLRVLNMITGMSKSKTLTKHLSCECKCKCDARKYNSNLNWNKETFMCIGLNEANEFIKIYDRTRYLVLFGPKR